MVMQIGAVKAFRGHAVQSGVINVTDAEFVNHLDCTYPEAVVCNVTVTPGNVLYVSFPNHFHTMKKEYEQELQSSLRSQLHAANDVDIDFH